MNGLKIKKDFTKQFTKALKTIGDKRVLVGIPQDEDNRTGEPIGNAALGRIHENGSPVRNIPARPFLIPGAKEANEQVPNILKAASIEALTQFDGSLIEKGLNRVGLHAQSVIKQRIVNQVGFKPLAKSTLAARKRKNQKGEKALIRTGELLNSIKYVLR